MLADPLSALVDINHAGDKGMQKYNKFKTFLNGNITVKMFIYTSPHFYVHDFISSPYEVSIMRCCSML